MSLNDRSFKSKNKKTSTKVLKFNFYCFFWWSCVQNSTHMFPVTVFVPLCLRCYGRPAKILPCTNHSYLSASPKHSRTFCSFCHLSAILFETGHDSSPIQPPFVTDRVVARSLIVTVRIVPKYTENV